MVAAMARWGAAQVKGSMRDGRELVKQTQAVAAIGSAMYLTGFSLGGRQKSPQEKPAEGHRLQRAGIVADRPSHRRPGHLREHILSRNSVPCGIAMLANHPDELGAPDRG